MKKNKVVLHLKNIEVIFHVFFQLGLGQNHLLRVLLVTRKRCRTRVCGEQTHLFSLFVFVNFKGSKPNITKPCLTKGYEYSRNPSIPNFLLNFGFKSSKYCSVFSITTFSHGPLDKQGETILLQGKMGTT